MILEVIVFVILLFFGAVLGQTVSYKRRQQTAESAKYMKRQKDKLVEIIMSEFGLLDKLLSSGALTYRETEEVDAEEIVFKRNEVLLKYIFQKQKHQDLLKALRDSGQTHVVNWIQANGEYKSAFGKDWPLTETEHGILDCNQESLIDTLHADELIPRLYSAQVINARQRDFALSKQTLSKQSKALLDVVRRSSLGFYSVLLNCVRELRQPNIATILQSGGVIVRTHVTLESDNLEEAEAQIVSVLTDLILGTVELIERASRLLKALRLKLIAAKRGGSIILYIGCNREDDLDHLSQVIDNSTMRDVLQQLFNSLIHDLKVIVVLVQILDKDFTEAKQSFQRYERDRMISIRKLKDFQQENESPDTLLVSENDEENIGQDVEEDHKTCIRRKYTGLLGSLTKISKLIEEMYEKEKLTYSEVDRFQQFQENPMKASEELLIMLISKPKDVYDCFLGSLRNTKQEFLYQWMTSEAFGRGLDTAENVSDQAIPNEPNNDDEKAIHQISSSFVTDLHSPTTMEVVGEHRDISDLERDKYERSPVKILSKFRLLDYDLQLEISLKMDERQKKEKLSNVDVMKRNLQRMQLIMKQEWLEWSNKVKTLQNAIDETSKTIVTKFSKTMKEKMKELAECCICRESFTDPRVLPCIHTFCLKCLNEASTKAEKKPGDSMPCSLCRKEFVIPKQGMIGLKKNFIMVNLIELSAGINTLETPTEVSKRPILTALEKQVEVAEICEPLEKKAEETELCKTPEKIICEFCIENKEDGATEMLSATQFCTECQKNICDRCSREHNRIKQYRAHQLVHFGIPEVGDLIKKDAKQYCNQHKEKELEMYCFDCKQDICVKCLAEEHCAHECSDFGKGSDKSLEGIVYGVKQTISEEILKKIQMSSNEQKKHLSSLEHEDDDFHKVSYTDSKKIRSNMEYQKVKLIEIIDSDFGLLDNLLRNRVLTQREIFEVRSEGTIFRRNEALMNFIFQKKKHLELLTALSETGQIHVVNWVKGNGERKDEFGLDFPLTETELWILDANQEFLIDALDSLEIFHYLFSRGLINKRQRDFIQSKTTDYEKNDAFLSMIRRWSLKSYLALNECLRRSGQSHVAEILETGGVIVPVHASVEDDKLDETETRIIKEMSEALALHDVSGYQANRLLAALQLKVIGARSGR